MPPFDFADLFRRRSDAGPDLVAIDGTDRFILDEAPNVHGDAVRQPGAVTVVDDVHGVITLGVLALHGAADVRVVQDSLVGERALEANAGTFGLRGFHHPVTLEDAFRDVRLVVLRLSKSHDRLDEIARAVARFAVAVSGSCAMSSRDLPRPRDAVTSPKDRRSTSFCDSVMNFVRPPQSRTTSGAANRATARAISSSRSCDFESRSRTSLASRKAAS